ncbi:MAG: acetyl-coenzyme A synthetase [Amphiamblys sp. WSBS2006]|nr:MAG: acetyl-coenzyme A synthetase [Amphiamblys sp. WSBS2006]
MKAETTERLFTSAQKNGTAFWAQQAKELLTWDTEFTKTFTGTFESPRWFEDGSLNACYNCIDRHAKKTPQKAAIIYSDKNNEAKTYTFKEAQEKIVELSSFLLSCGLKKGDVVCVYLTMSQDAVFTVLACARLGIVHNVVFGGFSAKSLSLRLEDSNAKFLITQDIAERKDTPIDFLSVAADALAAYNVPTLVFDSGKQPTGSIEKTMAGFKTHIWSQVCPKNPAFVPCVPVNAEDLLFYLYTSGSTGKPKGIIHTTGGYLCYAAFTTKVCFELREDDVFACTADIGWITGHTYAIYGPLLNGVTTVILGGIPFYPSYYRLPELVKKHAVTQLYTAPTVIRTMAKFFTTTPFEKKHDLSSLRLLGSVGEPLNKEAHRWFKNTFNNCEIIDTYWQTESGGVLVAPLPSLRQPVPECADFPLPGHSVVIADPASTPENVIEAQPNTLGPVLFGNPWPGIARGILKNPGRFHSAYFCYTGYYFTGDEGHKDWEGRVWVKGRSDDVINVSGHRLSTAEIEGVTCGVPNIAEAAVVGLHDDITGQAVHILAVLKQEADTEKLEKDIRAELRSEIGKHIHPKKIHFVEALPKTAAGKIMRRHIRDTFASKGCFSAADSVVQS